MCIIVKYDIEKHFQEERGKLLIKLINFLFSKKMDINQIQIIDSVIRKKPIIMDLNLKNIR